MDKDEIEDIVGSIVGNAQRHLEERMDENYKDLCEKIDENYKDLCSIIEDNDNELSVRDQKLLDRLDEDVRDMIFLMRGSLAAGQKYLDGNYAGRD